MKNANVLNWAAKGGALINKNYRYDLGADDMRSIMDRYSLLSLLDPNAVFELVVEVYRAGFYRGHNMGKREDIK